jgi:hypothetical protein
MAKKGPEPRIQSRLGGKLNGKSDGKISGHVKTNGKTSPTPKTDDTIEKGSIKNRLGSLKSKNKKKNWEKVDARPNGKQNGEQTDKQNGKPNGKPNDLETILDKKPNLEDLKDIKIRVKNRAASKSQEEATRPEIKPKSVDNHETSSEDQAKKNARLAKFGIPDGAAKDLKTTIKTDSTAQKFQSMTIVKPVGEVVSKKEKKPKKTGPNSPKISTLRRRKVRQSEEFTKTPRKRGSRFRCQQRSRFDGRRGRRR